jgi:hypothetical protein
MLNALIMEKNQTLIIGLRNTAAGEIKLKSEAY